MFSMSESFGAATEDDILQLEARLTAMLSAKLRQSQSVVVLPEDYKQFLRQTNGGYPTKNLFQHKDFGISCVDLYFGVGFPEHDGRSVLDSTYSLRCMGEAFDSFIEVATDPGGLRICLGVGKHNLGQVFLFDHDSACADDENPLIFIADSFSEFFNGCYLTDEEVEAAFAQSTGKQN
jgi:hypothetical protein